MKSGSASILQNNIRVGHARGWSFTPLNGKRPTLSGWNTAPRESLAEALEWGAAGNVGLRCGQISGVVVIDVDPGGDIGPFNLLDTISVVTGKNGRHFYFKAPPGVSVHNSAGKLGPHIDVRGDGGQVVYPGSVHPETEETYRWEDGCSPSDMALAEFPPPLLARLQQSGAPAPAAQVSSPPVRVDPAQSLALPPAPPAPPSPAGPPAPPEPPPPMPPVPPLGRDAKRRNYLAAAIARECRTVASAQEGTRNNTLNVGAFSLGQFVGGGALSRDEVERALLDAALSAGLPRGEAEATIRSGLSKGEAKPRKPPAARRGTGAHQGAAPPADTPAIPAVAEVAPVLVCMADVRPESIQWLWPGRIALGKVTLLFGDPGLGKSFLTLDIAARVSRGMPWPDFPGERFAPGGVILLSAEDDVADTIRPRLDAAGADVARIALLQGVRYGDSRMGYFSLADDLPALEAAIRQTPDARLVVIDPVSAYLGGTDSHKNADVRGLLAPLADLAARYDVAVVTVTHMSKGIAGRALYRAMGSLGFIAAARAAWLIATDPDNPRRRLFLSAKNNLAREPSGMGYALESRDMAGIGPVGCVIWEKEPVLMTADAALAAAAADPEGRTAISSAIEWLRAALAAGPMTVVDLRAAAKAGGVAWGTIRRAQAVAGVMVRRQGFGADGKWYWALPNHAAESHAEGAQPSIDAHHTEVSTYDENDASQGAETGHFLGVF